jgi:hypothetical protein
VSLPLYYDDITDHRPYLTVAFLAKLGLRIDLSGLLYRDVLEDLTSASEPGLLQDMRGYQLLDHSRSSSERLAAFLKLESGKLGCRCEDCSQT